MALFNISDLIIEKLKVIEREDVICQINVKIEQGSTGGEIAAGVARFLLNLEKEDNNVYKEIKDLKSSL